MLRYEELQAVVEGAGHLFFTGEKNINLVGFRKENVVTNEWDDHLLIGMEFGAGKQIIQFDEFTTDPGFYYLKEQDVSSMAQSHCAVGCVG